MPISVPDAVDFLGSRASNLIVPANELGCPVGELVRSPAANRVAELAAESGLFLFHYEHRAHLDLPDDWVPPGQAELAAAPEWRGAVLPERKYQSFRHDLPLGGFHPGHRAKWSTHELCHGLVGFAWRADATPFFLATAGRLAELLPVVLWYFLDEAFLTRCPEHQGGGALFRTLCPRCETAAAARVDDPAAREHLEGAKRYLDRELAAVAKSRRLGRPVAHHHATLDLCSDGLAYAAAHGERLGSRAFARFAERFLEPGAAWLDDLDALEARVIETANALCGGELRPHGPDPAACRELWTRQDVAWRIAAVAHQCEDEVAEALDTLLDDLASGGTLQAAWNRYHRLWTECFIPPPHDVFAVGYDLPWGQGHAHGQLAAGIRGALPLTTAVLGENLSERVQQWSGRDAWTRTPVTERFAADLASDGALGDLARFEAAVGGVVGRDAEAAALGVEGLRYRLASTARVLRFGCDVVDLAEGVELGDYLWVEDGDSLLPVHGDGSAVTTKPTALVVGADLGGQTLVLDVRSKTADLLDAIDWLGIPVDGGELEALRRLGVLVPVRWAETRE